MNKLLSPIIAGATLLALSSAAYAAANTNIPTPPAPGIVCQEVAGGIQGMKAQHNGAGITYFEDQNNISSTLPFTGEFGFAGYDLDGNPHTNIKFMQGTEVISDINVLTDNNAWSQPYTVTQANHILVQLPDDRKSTSLCFWYKPQPAVPPQIDEGLADLQLEMVIEGSQPTALDDDDELIAPAAYLPRYNTGQSLEMQITVYNTGDYSADSVSVKVDDTLLRAGNIAAHSFSVVNYETNAKAGLNTVTAWVWETVTPDADSTPGNTATDEDDTASVSYMGDGSGSVLRVFLPMVQR